MEKKFGIFESSEEINRAAAAQLQQGDTEAVLLIAKENGIDEEDAKDYINGDVTELCTPLMAAFGKLKVESEDVEIFGAFEMWKGYIMEGAANDSDLCAAIMKKDKTLIGALAAVLKEESKHRKNIDKKICKEAGIPSNVPMSTLTKPEQIKALRSYYLGGAA